MAAQQPDPEIEKLLAELDSDDPKLRQAAAEQIQQLKLRNDEIRQALRFVAATDEDSNVKSAAPDALRSLDTVGARSSPAAQPPDPEIEKLLAELRSGWVYRRMNAPAKIKERGLRNDEIIKALEVMAESDSNRHARQAATEALTALGVGEPGSTAGTAAKPGKPVRQWSRNEKIRDFLIGFVGWYVVNGALWAALARGASISTNEFGLFPNLLILPVNVLVLIITAFTRKWFALGLLTSFAVNWVLALLLGLTFNAYCWVPFFIK
jgi:hypothetical protein